MNDNLKIIILRGVIGLYMGAVSGAVGWSLSTWQFWIIAVPMALWVSFVSERLLYGKKD